MPGEAQMRLRLGAGRTVSVSWVARQLGVTDQTVRNYLEEGKLDGYKHPGSGYWQIFYESYVALVSRASSAGS